MTKKRDLGQFNTTNKDYILSGFEWLAGGKHWIDPFAGMGDLLEWADRHGASSVKGYDIDPELGYEQRDTLASPPDYCGKWIIANPPYLARNKNKDKRLYDETGLDDYYKIALRTALPSEGGIFIVPLNFLSAEGSAKIRREFFARFDIMDCRVFEERVFDDTDYTVCAFTFARKAGLPDETAFSATFLPSGRSLVFCVTSRHDYVMGQAFYEWLEGVELRGIGRYTLENYAASPSAPLVYSVNHPDSKRILDVGCPDVHKNIMLLRAIDTGTAEGRIRLMDIRDFKPHLDCLPGLDTSRNYAHIRLDDPPSLDTQAKVIAAFNERLEEFRHRYNSVFLTAYRNSTKEYSRKRIGFDVAYKIVLKCLQGVQ